MIGQLGNGRRGFTACKLGSMEIITTKITMSIRRSKTVMGGLRLIKAFIFDFTGGFPLLPPSIPSNSNLDPKNMHLGNFNMHQKYLRVSAKMSKYAIMMARVNAVRKTSYMMFLVVVFGNGTASNFL